MIRFENDYSEGTHGIRMAMLLKKVFKEQGFSFWLDSKTNQQFPILSNGEMECCAVLYQLGDKRSGYSRFRKGFKENVQKEFIVS